jgi:hypothetical protein
MLKLGFHLAYSSSTTAAAEEDRFERDALPGAGDG